jgi:N-methylhydantoinase B/oxoprolinase/acetone carboxylase alpha subunit
VLAKTPSTPSEPVQAVVSALDTSGVALKEIAFLILGTTVATNALLQRQGTYVLFLTTEGSGWGGTTHDGGNVLCPENGNCRNAPVEVFESKYPFASGASRRRTGRCRIRSSPVSRSTKATRSS